MTLTFSEVFKCITEKSNTGLVILLISCSSCWFPLVTCLRTNEDMSSPEKTSRVFFSHNLYNFDYLGHLFIAYSACVIPPADFLSECRTVAFCSNKFLHVASSFHINLLLCNRGTWLSVEKCGMHSVHKPFYFSIFIERGTRLGNTLQTQTHIRIFYWLLCRRYSYLVGVCR